MLTERQKSELLQILKSRFEHHALRHKNLLWNDVEHRLLENPDKLEILGKMEETGGEPDVIACDEGRYIFCDCAAESPKGRRSLCYDDEALEARKTYKPAGSAIEMAKQMGIELLNEEQYFKLQALEHFDMKTASWIKTPAETRKLGGALFGDFRFGRVFIYHNGAESYYGARGFRALLKV